MRSLLYVQYTLRCPWTPKLLSPKHGEIFGSRPHRFATNNQLFSHKTLLFNLYCTLLHTFPLLDIYAY